MTVNWTITLKTKVKKKISTLPDRIRAMAFALFRDIELSGPVQGSWPNYSKLSGNRHHCHLKKGKPTYVAVWAVTDQERKTVEVMYVGTHEKAPY